MVKKGQPTQAGFNGPTKAPSGYFLFADEVRAGVIQELRDTKGAEFKISMAAAEIGRRWKEEVSEADKTEKYNRKSAELKKAYDEAFTKWKASEDFMKFRQAEAAWKQKMNDKDAKVQLAASGMPKKPMTARFQFNADNTAAVIQELRATDPNKKVTMQERSDALTKRWQALSEEERKRYEEQAVAARKDYDVKIAEFKNSDAFKKHEKAQNDRKKAALKKLAEDAGMPKQPADATHLFYQVRKLEIYLEAEANSQQKPDLKTVNEQLRKEWTAKDAAAKGPYETQAAAARGQYDAEMKVFQKKDEYKKYAKVAGLKRRRATTTKKAAGSGAGRKKRKVNEDGEAVAAAEEEESPEEDDAGDDEGDADKTAEDDEGGDDVKEEE